MFLNPWIVDGNKSQNGHWSLIFSISLKFLLLNFIVMTSVINLPPLHLPPHPKGDVGSQNGTRDAGKTSCHHSMDLRASQPAHVWTNQENWVCLKERDKDMDWVHLGLVDLWIIISVMCFLLFSVNTVVYMSQEYISSCGYWFCWRCSHGNLHYEANLGK